MKYSPIVVNRKVSSKSKFKKFIQKVYTYYQNVKHYGNFSVFVVKNFFTHTHTLKYSIY